MPSSELSDLVVRAYAAQVGLTVERVRGLKVIPLHMIAGVMLLSDAELHRLAGD